MRLRRFGILAVAVTLPLLVHAQQPAPGGEEAGGGDAEQVKTQEHAVTPPKVSCKGNTLSISANYSALGAILGEVQRCTGVQFDAPEVAKSSLVFDEIGPGPSSDVLAALLNASGFDYVLGASAADPEKIEKIVLLIRTNDKDGGAPEGRGSSPGRRAFAQMREAARPKSPEEQQEAAAEIEAADADVGVSRASEPESAPAKQESATAKAGAGGSATEAQRAGSRASQEAGAQGKADAAAATSAEAAPTPPAQENPAATRQASPTEDRIANMQTLFEQRRQMMQQQQSQRPAPQ